jgi:hypothetical protein
LEKYVTEITTQKNVFHSERLYFTFRDIGHAIEQLTDMSFEHKFTQKVKYHKVSLEQTTTILNNTVSTQE